MESLQDQIDEVLLKSNLKIEDTAEELQADVTEYVSEIVLMKKIQTKHGSSN